MRGLLTRNPLAFPAGVSPGYNPNHPASSNRLRFSGVVNNGNFVNLLTGKVGVLTNSSGYTHFNHGLLGPALRTIGFFQQPTSVFEPYAIAANEDVTMAAFMQGDQASGDTALFSNNGGANNGFGHALMWSGGQVKLVMQGVIFVGPSGNNFLPEGTTGFLAMSWTKIFNLVNCVSINLATGVIITEVMGTGGFGSLGGTGGASCFGFGSNTIKGSVGPMMWSARYMQMSDLVAWASNPWAFWYPDD